MANSIAKRQSHCIICGKRMSYQTPVGEIRWLTCHLDDAGIYCEECFASEKIVNLRSGSDIPGPVPRDNR